MGEYQRSGKERTTTTMKLLLITLLTLSSTIASPSFFSGQEEANCDTCCSGTTEKPTEEPTEEPTGEPTGEPSAEPKILKEETTTSNSGQNLKQLPEGCSDFDCTTCN